MALVKASKTKSYEVDELPMLRVLSSGIKISKKTASDMGITVGDKLQYAQDDETKDIYIFEGSEEDGGSTLGKTLAVSNKGLESKLKLIAKVPTLEMKGGNAIHFSVSTEATIIDDTEFFLLVFEKVEEKSADEVSEDEIVGEEEEELV